LSNRYQLQSEQNQNVRKTFLLSFDSKNGTEKFSINFIDGISAFVRR
jgi:hypothetical protein